jgi:hypothetical protein
MRNESQGYETNHELKEESANESCMKDSPQGCEANYELKGEQVIMKVEP